MTDTLPAPLVPPDVDLRGLDYMPFFGNHLFGSEFDARSTDSEWRAGVTLWWASWNQVPAASLPNDDVALARLADLGRDVKAWRRVKERALHGFVLCNDGRFYHRFLAKQAMIAWEKRAEDRAKRENEAERKRRERLDRSRMFEQLRAVGITPAWNIPTVELRNLVTQHVTPTDDQVTRPVTVTVTAKTGRDGTGHDGTDNQTQQRASPSSIGSTTLCAQPADPSQQRNPEQQAASRGAMAARLRDEGVDVTSSNPLLVQWVELGVTGQEAHEAVDRARLRKPKPTKIPAAYLDPIIRDVLAERNGTTVSGKSCPRGEFRWTNLEWWMTDEGIKAQAAARGAPYDDPVRTKCRLAAMMGDGPWIDHRNATELRLIEEFRKAAA